MSDAPPHPELEQVLETARGVEGWLSTSQAVALYEAASACPPAGRIVEIGSFRGRSTVVLASAAPADAEVVAIDPHAGNDRGPGEIEGFEVEAADDHAAFVANLRAAGVEDRVRHVRRMSDAAHDEVATPIDVLYIDGAHRFAPAAADISTWGARVAPGGSMLVHDAFSSVGVTLAILRHLLFGTRFRYIGRRRSLAVYRADLASGARPVLANAMRQLAQLPWFARNLALKVALRLGLGHLARRLGRRVPEWPY